MFHGLTLVEVDPQMPIHQASVAPWLPIAQVSTETRGPIAGDRPALGPPIGPPIGPPSQYDRVVVVGEFRLSRTRPRGRHERRK